MLRRSRIGGAAFCLNCRGKKSNWGKLRGKTHCGEVQSQLFPCGIRDNRKKKDQKLNISSLFLWQRVKDSNPHKRSQSPVCYHYTNPLSSFDEHLLLYHRFSICQYDFANFAKFFFCFAAPHIQIENRRSTGANRRRNTLRCAHSSGVTSRLWSRIPSISSSRFSIALAP